jgi:hypothetical protein
MDVFFTALRRSPKFSSRRWATLQDLDRGCRVTQHRVADERGLVLCSTLRIATNKDYPSAEWRGGKGIRT